MGKELKLGIVQQYHVNNINGFINYTDALNCVYHANAGWGKSIDAINADPTGGKAKATLRMPELINFVNHI